MVNHELARSYFRRSGLRLRILEEYMKHRAFAEVVREAQEVVELLQKAVLIALGIRPPKWHEVGDLLLMHREKLPVEAAQLAHWVQEGKWLRSQRELAFYGDMDVIPERFYTEADARRAIATARWFYGLARQVMGAPGEGEAGPEPPGLSR